MVMIFILLTVINLSLGQSDPIGNDQDMFTCATSAGNWVCPEDNGDGDWVASLCCFASPEDNTHIECQSEEMCKEGNPDSNEGLVYQREGSTGSATITSGNGGCSFDAETSFDCENFSGNMDEDEFAYWKGTLVVEESGDERRNLDGDSDIEYTYYAKLESGTSV